MHIAYALYAPADTAIAFQPGGGAGLKVITMDTAFSGMPDAVWLKRLLPNAAVTCRSNNRKVQAQLCAGGAGLAILPRPLGDMTPGIMTLTLDDPPPGRDTFVGYHRHLRRLSRMRVARDGRREAGEFGKTVFRQQRTLLTGAKRHPSINHP